MPSSIATRAIASGRGRSRSRTLAKAIARRTSECFAAPAQRFWAMRHAFRDSQGALAGWRWDLRSVSNSCSRVRGACCWTTHSVSGMRRRELRASSFVPSRRGERQSYRRFETWRRSWIPCHQSNSRSSYDGPIRHRPRDSARTSIDRSRSERRANAATPGVVGQEGRPRS